ncbi:hypothetical protein, partial [Eggerthella lenta]
AQMFHVKHLCASKRDAGWCPCRQGPAMDRLRMAEIARYVRFSAIVVSSDLGFPSSPSKTSPDNRA